MPIPFKLPRVCCRNMLLSGATMMALTAGALVLLNQQFSQLETDLHTQSAASTRVAAAAADLSGKLSRTNAEVAAYLETGTEQPPELEDRLNLTAFDTPEAVQRPTVQHHPLVRRVVALRQEYIARGDTLFVRHEAWKAQRDRLAHAVRSIDIRRADDASTPAQRASLQSAHESLLQRTQAYLRSGGQSDLIKIKREANALLQPLTSTVSSTSLAQTAPTPGAEISALVNETLRLQQSQTLAYARFRAVQTQLAHSLQALQQQLVGGELSGPHRATDTAAQRALWLVALLGAALCAVGMFAIWRIARTTSEPLNKLKHGAAMLRAGNFAHRVEYTRDDTFGELIQDFNQMSDHLQRNLTRLEHSNQQQAQQIEAGTRELIAQTSHDALTGLPNRGSLHQFMEKAIERCRDRNGRFALLQIDLDGFKNINVSEGHDQGDRLLRVIGRRLQGQIQEEDLAARVGGDEFCVVLMHADLQRTTDFARRCLQAMNAPIYLDGIKTRQRASIGITFFPEDGATPHELMKAADMAVYAAKNAGKHRYALYENGMTQKVTRQFALETALREAVERGEFELHYQPQIELGSGRMCGVEALIRWPRPNHGLVPPDEFIPVAERVGLIDAIGVWVLETACRQAVLWHQQGLPSLVMAVNISPGHFESPDFIDTIARVLMVTGIAPECLEIEVTESVTRDSLRHASISESLRGLGVRVAIDDFGTGYSSLAVLKKMPIDTLKLDRAFIRDMLEDSGSSMLIGTLIGMAKGLHLTTVAEGVETLEQVRVLTGLGCPLAQGYYFSRPVKADLIPALARTDFLLRASEDVTLVVTPLTGTHGT